MRVITGLARGCRLDTLEGLTTRPTGARTKDGIFSAIQFEIAGRKVLDLFAGSGQMGIEALSRGAESCVFIDKTPAAIDIIKKNLSSAAKFSEIFKKNSRVIRADSIEFLKNSNNIEKFDLVFLDPPFKSELLDEALSKISSVLNQDGIVVCEKEFSGKGEFSEKVGDLTLRKEYKYGQVKIGVYNFK